MIGLAAFASILSASAAARRFVNANAAMALAAAGIAAVVIGAGAAGIAWIRADARAVALVAERAAAEVRRLQAENAIWKASLARRTRILDQRSISLEIQEHEIADLTRQLQEARDATKVDPSRPVIPADDPWLRHGAARAQAGDRTGARR